MRANTPPTGMVRPDAPVEPLDLVLVRHSLQFPTSRWPAVRTRLGLGRLHTATLPEDVFPGREEIDHERAGTRKYRDRLRFDLAARTLFVVGSAEAFRNTGASMIRPLAAASGSE
ncbi:hypothetical protein [Streptosporangium carneum]|uniref:Uncharacterized protein n=1 Tax=Streptosporangium carneum TaxID=47481 RepID=A0A9W6MGR5_9ACTN|nr:hypothetical protein [Streptosporangium carneum]GLK13435.1 hypothetical protein GCM10017600_68460 [Streptosporangium carneum]